MTFRSKDIEVTVREPGDGIRDDQREDTDGYRALLTRLLLSIELCRIEYVLARVVVDMAEAGETGGPFWAASDSFVGGAIGVIAEVEESDASIDAALANTREDRNGTA